MKTLVVSPTFNERKNIDDFLDKVKTAVEGVHILIVDDNSPDGTGQRIKERQEKDPNLYLISRAGKLGLGTAYCTGFKWAIDNGYDIVVQMDADLSHNPEDIPRLIAAAKKDDLILGSRYTNGVNVVNWPMSRLLLSFFANQYARIVAGVPVRDATGGFKCFNIAVLKDLDLENVKSTGYSFQIEMTMKARAAGYSVNEVSIVFTDRTVGQSKMSRAIIWEAIFMVPRLRLRKIFGNL